MSRHVGEGLLSAVLVPVVGVVCCGSRNQSSFPSCQDVASVGIGLRRGGSSCSGGKKFLFVILLSSLLDHWLPPIP